MTTYYLLEQIDIYIIEEEYLILCNCLSCCCCFFFLFYFSTELFLRFFIVIQFFYCNEILFSTSFIIIQWKLCYIRCERCSRLNGSLFEGIHRLFSSMKRNEKKSLKILEWNVTKEKPASSEIHLSVISLSLSTYTIDRLSLCIEI